MASSLPSPPTGPIIFQNNMPLVNDADTFNMRQRLAELMEPQVDGILPPNPPNPRVCVKNCNKPPRGMGGSKSQHRYVIRSHKRKSRKSKKNKRKTKRRK